VSALGNNINYQIAVMLGYPGGSQSGTLWNASVNGKTGPVLSSSSLSPSAIETALKNDIADAPESNINVNDPAGNSISQVHGEFGTLSLMNALDTNLAAIRKQGFFRTNAALAVIFAANEADNCFIGSDDDDQVEQGWKVDFCNGASGKTPLTEQTVVNAVSSLQGTNPYLFGFIGYQTYPLTSGGQQIDEEERGDGYLDIATLTSGVVANMDPGSMDVGSNQQSQIIATGLANVGALAKSKLMLTTTFMLDPGAVSSTITVYINGVLQTSAQWTYDAGTNSVTIPGVASQDAVMINYFVLQ
jgi:hypothetical protein